MAVVDQPRFVVGVFGGEAEGIVIAVIPAALQYDAAEGVVFVRGHQGAVLVVEARDIARSIVDGVVTFGREFVIDQKQASDSTGPVQGGGYIQPPGEGALDAAAGTEFGYQIPTLINKFLVQGGTGVFGDPSAQVIVFVFVVRGSHRDLDQAVFGIVDVVFCAVVGHVACIVVIDGQTAGGVVLIESVVRVA